MKIPGSSWAGAAFAGAYRRWGRSRIRTDGESILAAARATMKRKQYCLIATHAAEGIHARVVQPYPPRDDFSVLMGTDASSRKVAELEADPRATLVYQDDGRAACVTLMGRVSVLRDPKDKRFMTMWRAFWPDGPEDPGFVNLLFVPAVIEVWDASRGITPEPFGLVSARVVRQNGVWR